MTRTFATAAIIVTLVPSAVFAQHRAGDAALGALSGAVVLGPVGAVAGAVVGYTAGPSIAHSWGLRRSQSRSSRRHETRNASRAAPAGTAEAAAVGDAKKASTDRTASAPVTTAPGSVSGSTQVAKPQQASTTKPPPVQALE